jgi:hypothetical protein
MATVCEWYVLKTTRTVFTGLTSKPVVTVSGGLASKPAVTVSGDLASKPVATVSGSLASKPVAMVSSGLTSKPVATVSVWPQNLLCRFPDLGLKTDIYILVIWVSKSPRRFLGLSLKTKRTSVYRLCHKTEGGREVDTGHASRSSGLLRMEASQTRVSQSGLKTGRGATASGTYGTIVEVASSPN